MERLINLIAKTKKDLKADVFMIAISSLLSLFFVFVWIIKLPNPFLLSIIVFCVMLWLVSVNSYLITKRDMETLLIIQLEMHLAEEQKCSSFQCSCQKKKKKC